MPVWGLRDLCIMEDTTNALIEWSRSCQLGRSIRHAMQAVALFDRAPNVSM